MFCCDALQSREEQKHAQEMQKLREAQERKEQAEKRAERALMEILPVMPQLTIEQAARALEVCLSVCYCALIFFSFDCASSRIFSSLIYS